MALDRQSLFDLLPAIHKVRDAGQGGVLELLLSVFGEQIEVLQENLDQLYDDQFIETCAPWVVPYIGDLVGARGVKSVAGTAFRARAYVANTIAYRRRKGTAAMIEQLARDVTNWPAAVVEMFEHLVATQHMNHLRPHSRATPDLRNGRISEEIDTAFDRTSHIVDVRRISSGRGKHNIPNVAIFLWRIAAYPLTNSPAVSVDAQRFLFNPLGKDIQLYTQPETEDEIAHLAEPVNVPMPITIRAMSEDVEAFYGPEKSVFVTVDGNPVAVEKIDVCNLADDGGGWQNTPAPAGMVSIDPERGRIALSANATEVRVMFHYGFAADLGGGEYERGESLTSSPVVIPIARPQKISDALTILGTRSGVIELTDNGRYTEAVAVKLAKEQRVEIRSRNGRRPYVGGAITVEGDVDSELTLNGLLIDEAVTVPQASNHLAHLRIKHCTLVPRTPSVKVDADSGELHLLIDHAITGALQINEGAGELTIRDSIVDGAIDGGGANAACPATIERATLFGAVHVQELTLGSESIFTERVVAHRRQTGCVRFSFVRIDPGNVSQTPRRHRCQPDLEIDTNGNAASVVKWLRPSFVSTHYGDAGYALLKVYAPVQIRTGAEDGSEMGAFHMIQAARREANLRAALDEYLRFGLEAGIFYAI